MRHQLICVQILTLIVLHAVAVTAEPPKPLKVEPLETAYTDLIASKEQFADERLTEVQKLSLQLEKLDAAGKAIRNKTYSVRLRVSAVTQPLGPNRLLVHAQYVDPEQVKLFGKDATVGVWTDDPKTASKLHIGDEIELQGKIFYGVHYLEQDVDRIKNEWKERNLNISVALLRGELTGWLREATVYMVNPRIIPIQTESVEGSRSDQARAVTDAAETPKTLTIEPLTDAYVDLIATEAQLDEYKRMTEVQKLARQLEQLKKAVKECHNITYSVRLRVSAVTLGPKRFLVHGQYVDPDQVKLFGKDANVGIWTEDAKTAAKLSIGDEIELRGKIFYGVGYFDRDVDRIKDEWKERNMNISVACLHGYLTGWLRGTSIYMVNPQIEPIQSYSVEGQE
jgi:hypothetical protein